jgi:hypothetical protein
MTLPFTGRRTGAGIPTTRAPSLATANRPDPRPCRSRASRWPCSASRQAANWLDPAANRKSPGSAIRLPGDTGRPGGSALIGRLCWTATRRRPRRPVGLHLQPAPGPRPPRRRRHHQLHHPRRSPPAISQHTAGATKCWDRTLVWNQRHLMTVLREYEDYYNTRRPHRALNQAAPLRPPAR